LKEERGKWKRTGWGWGRGGSGGGEKKLRAHFLDRKGGGTSFIHRKGEERG